MVRIFGEKKNKDDKYGLDLTYLDDSMLPFFSITTRKYNNKCDVLGG